MERYEYVQGVDHVQQRLGEVGGSIRAICLTGCMEMGFLVVGSSGFNGRFLNLTQLSQFASENSHFWFPDDRDELPIKADVPA